MRVVAVTIVPHPTGEQARRLAEVLSQQGCTVLFTVNEWGIDTSGELWSYLEKTGTVHVNWCVDDPFFEEIMLTKKFRPSSRRLDFVSDRGYVEPMKVRGYNVSFLPLATDPTLYFPDPHCTPENDVVFVGNSYVEQMDRYARQTGGFLERILPFLADLVQQYNRDCGFDVESAVEAQIRTTRLPGNLSRRQAVFVAKHFAGYLHRKQTVVALARRYKGFRVVGDDHWLSDIPEAQFGRARYGKGLCDVYRKSRIVVDINRVVIRDGFTQRVFDALASGAFVLTSAKPVVGELFTSEGSEAELGTFRNLDELTALIDHYLAAPEELRETALRGRRKVLSQHTYDHRIAAIFATLASAAGNERPAITPA